MAKFKAGDRVRCVGDAYSGMTPGSRYNLPRHTGVVAHAGYGYLIVDYDGEPSPPVTPCCFELVEDEPSNASPVRKVTRTEIVPGTYGQVVVHNFDHCVVAVSLNRYLSSTNELRNAARIFNEIADALEQNKEAS